MVKNQRLIKLKRSLAVLIALLLLAAALEGCSESNTASNEGSSAESNSEEAEGLDDELIIENVLADLSDYSGTPVFQAASFEKIDAKSIIADKKIFLICADSTNDYMVGMTERYADLISALGGEAFIYYSDATNDSWITGIETAISSQYDVIDIVGGATIDTLENAISEAMEAGIYVQDTHNGDVSISFNDDCSVGADFAKALRLVCDEAIKEFGTPSEINALVVADIGLDSSDVPSKEGVNAVFDEYGIKYTSVEVVVTDWATDLSELVRTALISDPSINVIVAYYDNMLLYVTPVIEELGIDYDDVIIGSFNGSPGILDLVAEGKADYDLGESTGWIAAHALDCLLRGLAGMEIHNDLGTAVYMINQDNINDYLDPETGKGSYSYDGVTDIYLKGYSDLWGADVTNAFNK